MQNIPRCEGGGQKAGKQKIGEDGMRIASWLAALPMIFVIGLGGTAFAFHSGGVANCAGCHSMHNTPNSAVVGGAPGSMTGGLHLLAGSDQSSTCLNCHASNGSAPLDYHVMTYPFAGGTNVASVPVNRTPGGDFSWLLLSFVYTSQGTPMFNPGYGHGHNIIALDYGLTGSPTNATAPGGTFPSSSLHCNSCHDPHSKLRRDSTGAIQANSSDTPLSVIGSGSYPNSVPGAPGAAIGVTAPGVNQAVGVYRLLAGYSAYTAVGQTVAYPGAPMAIAPLVCNQTESLNQVRVAYGVGSGMNQVAWGAWCATCHPAMIGSRYHPVDGKAVLSAGNMMTNYNQYVSSGNMTGSSATAYLSLTPFMTGSNDVKVLALLADNTGTVAAAKQGPGAPDQASCLSCHRAHASGWRDGLRWNNQGEFITYVTSTGTATWPGTDTTPNSPVYADGMLASQVQSAYYDRPVTIFGANQRVLCNKCHSQD